VSLAERHLRELRDGSGIPLEVIAERGYATVTSRAELLERGFADYQARVPALLVPIWAVDGSNSRYVLKPDHPRLEHRPNKPDRPIKYDYPVGQPAALDVPVRCRPALLDAAVDLWITEGWKKADSLAAAGKCVIALGGVWNWCHKDAEGNSGVPLDDWQPILPSLDGRRVFICYDSDAVSNPSVGLAERRLANYLRKHGAWVSIVRLPAEPDGSKNGVDDFIVRHGVDALDELVEVATDASSDRERMLRARVRQLEQLLSAQSGVLRNADLSATQKVVAIATINEAGWAVSAHKPTPYRVDYGRLAAAAGVSPQTVSSAVKVLSEADDGLFTKVVTREYNAEAGQYRSRVNLTPRHDGGVVGLLRAAAEYHPERPAWGGKRTPRCPDHPHADVVSRRVIACAECGQVLDDSTTVLKSQDDISDAQPSSQALNDQLDISAAEPLPGFSVSHLRTTGDQVDSSEECTECGRLLYQGQFDRGVCDGCARALAAAP
jgi:hypothetical protein